MTFIGICSNEKDFKIIKSQFTKQNKSQDINFIYIKDSNIKNLQNIKFDALVIHEKIPIIENLEALEKICKNIRYLLINFDKNVNLNILNGNRLTVLTYGHNHKCTVTASSIKEEVIMIALQREVLDRKGILHGIEEEKMDIIQNLDVYGHMLLFVLGLIYD